MMNYRFAWLLGLSAVLAGLSGCNTARGFGADVEELGRLMQGKPRTVETIEVQQTAPAEPVYVEPQSTVETYPYQGGASYTVQPVQPAPAQTYPQQDPSLGEVVPAKTIKEM